MPGVIRARTWRITPCPVCSEADDIRVIGHRETHVDTCGGRYEFVFDDAICLRCGFVFARRVPDEDFLFDYYRTGHTRASEITNIPVSYDTGARLSVIRKYVRPGATILELGANDGAFLRGLRAAGFSVVGCDPLESDESGVVAGFFGNGSSPLVSEQYDAVVSYYVLEHVLEPVNWLRAAGRILKPGGALIVEVPNYRTHPHCSLNHEHLLHFSEAHLELALRRAGFGDIQFESENRSQYFGQVAVAQTFVPDSNFVPVGTDVGALIERGVNLYKLAERESARAEMRAQALAEWIKTDPTVGGRPVIVWAANEVATRVGRALMAFGIMDARIVDSASSKIGHQHEGFRGPVDSPSIIKQLTGGAVLVLCSPAYNRAIRAQIFEMNLSNAIVVEAS